MMLNSYELAAALVQRGFMPLTSPERTKAHGYEHPHIDRPVYVKVGGKAGQLQAVKKAPLVLHPEVAKQLRDTLASARGIVLEAEPRAGAGYLRFADHRNHVGTPFGYDCSIEDEAALDRLVAELLRMNGDQASDSMSLAYAAAEAAIASDPQCKNIPATTRMALVQARIGQGTYRDDLLKLWGQRCAVSGVDIPDVLIASHVKAWKRSSNSERLDPHNGLPLAASIDRLFDKGLISFDERGALLVKECLDLNRLATVGLSADSRLTQMPDRLAGYLRDHRQHFGFQSA